MRDGDVALVSSDPIPAPEPNDPVAAVPEPGVLGLFTLGLVGLMGFRRGRYNLKKTLQLISAGLAFNLVATTAYAGPMLLPGQTISIPGGSLIIVGDFGSLKSDIIWAVSDPQGSGAGQPEVGSDVGVENQGTAASIAASLLLLDSLNDTSNQGNSNNNAPIFYDTPQATSTAVPEPSVLGLFTLGLMGLMGVKRRRTV